MNEFIKKMIERLEYRRGYYNAQYESFANRGNMKREAEIRFEECDKVLEIVNQLAEEYNNGWIPCERELPPQPKENPIFEYKPLELYLVTDKDVDYPLRAFWNGKCFTDGWFKLEVSAWQPLPAPYQPKGE